METLRRIGNRLLMKLGAILQKSGRGLGRSCLRGVGSKKATEWPLKKQLFSR